MIFCLRFFALFDDCDESDYQFSNLVLDLWIHDLIMQWNFEPQNTLDGANLSNFAAENSGLC